MPAGRLWDERGLDGGWTLAGCAVDKLYLASLRPAHSPSMSQPVGLSMDLTVLPVLSGTGVGLIVLLHSVDNWKSVKKVHFLLRFIIIVFCFAIFMNLLSATSLLSHSLKEMGCALVYK